MRSGFLFLVCALAAGVVSAWEWPGTPVDVGNVADSPGMPVLVLDGGLRAVHPGRIVFVSTDDLIIDHGNGLWSVYHLSLSAESVDRLSRTVSDVGVADILVPTSDLSDTTVALSIWDQRRHGWIDPRLILSVPETTAQKVLLLGYQNHAVMTLADLSSGSVDFLVKANFSRLDAPREIALLINGVTVGRVRFGEIAGTPVHEYFGDSYFDIGTASLRVGNNQIEVIVFDYRGGRKVHEMTLAIRTGD